MASYTGLGYRMRISNTGLCLSVIAIYVIVSALHIGLPGLYFDSVNPDYLGVALAHENGYITKWLFNDNIFDKSYKFPILNSLYGIITPAYIALIFGKIFGFGIIFIRGLHIFYGTLIVLALFFMYSKAIRNPYYTALATLIACMDPSFVFGFRTQGYLQYFPLISFLPGMYLFAEALYADLNRKSSNEHLLVLAGLLLGFSAAGYFVFAFYDAGISLFALVILLVHIKKVPIRYLFFIGGLLIGYSPFLFGHFSLWHNSGTDGYIAMLKGLQTSYGVLDGQHDKLFERVQFFWSWLSTLSDGSIEAGLFDAQIGPVTPGIDGGAPIRAIYGIYVVVFMLLASLGGFIVTLVKQDLRWQFSGLILGFCLALLVAHFGLALLVGRPLGFQHYIMLLIPVYLGGLIGVNIVLGCIDNPFFKYRNITAAMLVVVAFCAHGNRIDQIYQQIRKTGGTGYYSDVVNNLGRYERTLPDDTILAFPQWGYWMGVVIITRGQYPVWGMDSVAALVDRVKQSLPHDHYAVTFEAEKAEEGIKTLLDAGLLLNDRKAFLTRQGETKLVLCDFVPAPDPSLAVDAFDPDQIALDPLKPATTVLRGSYPVEGTPGGRFVWLSSKATLSLRVASADIGKSLHISGSIIAGKIAAVIHGADPDILTISLNGRTIAEQKYTSDSPVDITIRWDRLQSLVVPNGVYLLTLKTTKSIIPKNYDLGPDERDLSMTLNSIKFK